MLLLGDGLAKAVFEHGALEKRIAVTVHSPGGTQTTKARCATSAGHYLDRAGHLVIPKRHALSVHYSHMSVKRIMA